MSAVESGHHASPAEVMSRCHRDAPVPGVGCERLVRFIPVSGLARGALTRCRRCLSLTPTSFGSPLASPGIATVGCPVVLLVDIELMRDVDVTLFGGAVSIAPRAAISQPECLFEAIVSRFAASRARLIEHETKPRPMCSTTSSGGTTLRDVTRRWATSAQLRSSNRRR